MEVCVERQLMELALWVAFVTKSIWTEILKIITSTNFDVVPSTVNHMNSVKTTTRKASSKRNCLPLLYHTALFEVQFTVLRLNHNMAQKGNRTLINYTLSWGHNEIVRTWSNTIFKGIIMNMWMVLQKDFVSPIREQSNVKFESWVSSVVDSTFTLSLFLCLTHSCWAPVLRKEKDFIKTRGCSYYKSYLFISAVAPRYVSVYL